MTLISLPDPPAPWSNQDLVVYHGTADIHTAELIGGRISVRAGRPDTDFGRGFYTTTRFKQAENWGKSTSLRKPGTNPAVIEFTLSRLALGHLESLAFVRGHPSADDLWSMIHHCRLGGSSHGRRDGTSFYDVVYGPIAMNWKLKIAAGDGDQISFHTAAAEAVLRSPTRKAHHIAMSQLSDQYKSYYWQTIEDCLVELHGLSRTDAIAAVSGYRSRLAAAAEESGPDWIEDLEFHQEPFSAACDLASHDLNYPEYLEHYFNIMRRNEQLAGLPIYPYPAATNIAEPKPELQQSTPR